LFSAKINLTNQIVAMAGGLRFAEVYTGVEFVVAENGKSGRAGAITQF